MAFIALKPCSLGGKMFRVGEVVPDSFVSGNRLVRFGMLTPFDDKTPSVLAAATAEPVTAGDVSSGESPRGRRKRTVKNDGDV